MRNSRHNSALRLLLLLGVLAVVLVAGIYLLQRRGYAIDDALTTVVEKSTDAATAANAKTALALSRRVSAFDIDVDADNGAVTLSGRVPSEAVRDLAGSIVADTTSVREVRNQLEVDPKASPDPEVERLVARVEELELQATLLEALRADPALRRVVPEVGDGRVVLQGEVDTTEARLHAAQLARQVAGNVTLEDRMEVAPAVAVSDSSPSERVEFALYSSGAFDLSAIEIVEEGAGAVTLQGTVRSRAEQLLAELIANDAEGVEMVVNELQVSGEPQVTADRSMAPAPQVDARP